MNEITDTHRLELLIEALTDHAVYMVDQDGFVISWNSGAERIKGYRSAEILGGHFSRFFTAEDRANRIPEKILAQARAGGRYEAEGWRLRKDGSRFWANAIITPVRGDHGDLIGFAKITRDITERRRAEVELRDSEARLRAIVNTAQNGIITIDDKGTIEGMNPAAARMFGYSPQEVVGRNVNRLMPEPSGGKHDSFVKDYLHTDEARVIGIERKLTGVRRNGSTFPLELTVSEIAMTGRQTFVIDVHDITNRVRNAERQATLMAELDHRVKNMLARVAAVADSTSQGSGSTGEFIESFNGRIQSMAAAHTLLSQTGWHGADLYAVVRNQLAPYAAGANTTVVGRDITLTASATQAMAMVLHELVTNAVKYGALSVPRGRVSVSWDIRSNREEAMNLIFLWRELDGPPAVGTIQSSYGTSLIRELIPHELGGTVDLVFAAEGVSCRIWIPIQQLDESAPTKN